MYLKSLTVQGFKSFPDKTVLNFGDDITAIVGPNGSGKSNISDAIRWVMGEQSTKSLRGTKMEDVIFGGTQKRGPLGFAEATLVLDNSDGTFRVDGSEVMVTRRYYRSGDSEFYINRQSARLRDINELFMDTGLGREGYSNISQGRIDEILAVRSVDRREVFEEAAGISKYRHRKEETERRLAATQDNLLRIGDKISELELQVEPLRVQAEKAKTYLACRGELKGLETAVWLDSLEKLALTAQKAENDFNSAVFILQQEHEALNALYTSAENLNLELHRHDTRAEEIRDEVAALDAEALQFTGHIAVLQASVENNTRNIERVESELSEADERRGGLSGQIALHETRIAEIEEKTKDLQIQLDELEAENRRLTGSADELTRRYLAQSARQTEVQTEIARGKADCQASEETAKAQSRRIREITQDCTSAGSRLEEARAASRKCSRALEDAQDEVTAAKNTMAGYALRLKTRSERRDALQKQCTSAQVELETVSSKLHMFQEMEKDYEGYSRAVKYVMQQAQRSALHNVHGPLSALIQTEDTYTVAIETALGAAAQQIVVSAEADGKAAIQSLRRSDVGRATFLPLSTIRGKRLQEHGLTQTRGFVGLASELVQFAPQYRQIVDNILGRTVIMEDLDCAISAANAYSHRFRIVTLDGQVLNAGGSMTGGAVSRSAGFLSRANEIKKLSERQDKLQKMLERAKTELQSAVSACAQVEFEQTAVRDQLREAEDEVLRLSGEAKQHKVLISAMEDAIAATERERIMAQQDLKTQHERQAAIQMKVAQLEQELQEIQSELAGIQSDQTVAGDRVAILAERLTGCKIQKAALEAEAQSVREAAQQLRGLERELQGDRAQKQTMIRHYQQETENLQQQMERAAAQSAEKSAQSAERRQALQQELAQRADIEAQKTRTEREAQEKNKNILNMERESSRLEQKRMTAQLEEKQIADKLWDTYGLTRSSAAEAAAEIESLAAAQRKISELKRKIASLGTPNLGAIEEYDRISERYEYLSTQRDDVLQARRDLELIIRDITTRMTEIFTTEFAKINTYFGQTFSEMFGGGKASLALEDPENPLTCGIDIRVQPPGKQLKTITLLSGGEKAFVAIALYFAILKVRPTPFCMLDEIDAALDDRNVERFAKYLRRLGTMTQFIVITHRRGTMEEADILYGVTMQEQGVSKILHLDLNQMERELGISEQ